MTAAASAGMELDAGGAAHPGIAAVAAAGVAGVSATAEPSVDAVAGAGLAGGPTDSGPSVDADAAAGADETVCVPRLAQAVAAPSSKIRSWFQAISCAVKKRLALS